MRKLFQEYKWINIFIRDVLLSLVMMFVNYFTHFRSWWSGVATGMLIVYVSWHFNDYLNYKRLKGQW